MKQPSTVGRPFGLDDEVVSVRSVVNGFCAAVYVVDLNKAGVERWRLKTSVGPRRYKLWNAGVTARLIAREMGLECVAGIRDGALLGREREALARRRASGKPAPSTPLRDLRRRSGLTFAAFCERAGLAVSTVSGVERGIMRLTERSAEGIARAAGVDVEDVRRAAG